MLSRKWRSTYSKQKDPTTRQVIAYKLLRTMENYKTVCPKAKCDRGRLQEVLIIGLWPDHFDVLDGDYL